MKQRIAGFDIARAYAILGMYIVNFNFSFGTLAAPADPVAHFLNIFTGNSTAIFIICAGMGVSLMTNRPSYTTEEKKKFRSVVTKRSWFLFAVGLLLYNWWSGDILHFYGGYMHIAALILFVPKRFYLFAAAGAIVIYHILLFIIPVETAWDFSNFYYTDFWTVPGFLRNTFYNGWNSMFPWLSYFLLGMWLGKVNWQSKIIRRNIFLIGLGVFVVFQTLRLLVRLHYFNDFWSNYIMSEYFPPYLPFVMITMGFACMVIPVCMYIGDKFSGSIVIDALVKTGQMTLSHYVIHLTAVMIIMAKLTGKHYTGLLEDEKPTPPEYILGYALLFYLLSVLCSVLWRKKFKHGPMETLMRKFSG